MKRVLIAAAVIVVVGICIKVGTNLPAVRQDPLATSAPAPAPATPAPKAIPAAGTESVERDATLVFQRAFWRRPGPDVRILGGERREWADGAAGLQKWAWFTALEAKPEFRQWLIEQNPFELSRADAPVDPARYGALPTWFPAAARWSDLTTYRTRGGGMVVFLDEKSGRIYAADFGSGFAAPAR